MHPSSVDFPTPLDPMSVTNSPRPYVEIDVIEGTPRRWGRAWRAFEPGSPPPSGREVEVEVVDDLATLRPRVAREPVPALPVTEALPEQPGHAHTMPHHSLVGRLEPRDGLNVTLGNDEEVDGRLRVEILEGDHLVVLVLDFCGTLPRHDATEDTASGQALLLLVYTRVGSRWDSSIIEGDSDGHVPKVQAEDSEERQPREARIGLVSQDVPRQGALRH